MDADHELEDADVTEMTQMIKIEEHPCENCKYLRKHIEVGLFVGLLQINSVMYTCCHDESFYGRCVINCPHKEIENVEK